MIIKLKNYIHNIWRGKESLFITFWAWFASVIILKSFLSIQIEKQVEFIEIDFENIKIYSLFILLIFYIIISSISVFRSAKNFKGKKIWKYLVKVIVIFYILLSFFSFFSFLYPKFFYDNIINNEITKLKKQLPMNLNDKTKLLDVYKDKLNIYYIFEIDNSKLNKAIRKNIKTQTINNLCKQEYSLSLLKHDYSLFYKYKNKMNNEILEVKTKKENCGKGIYDMNILEYLLRNQS